MRFGVWVFIVFFALSVAGGLIVISSSCGQDEARRTSQSKISPTIHAQIRADAVDSARQNEGRASSYAARVRYLYDDRGRRYLDFSAGFVAVNLGHGHPSVAAAIAEQAQRLTYAAPSFGNDKRAELARAIIELAPWDEGGRVFFTTGGGEANEDAMKFARAITGRHKILTAYRSFHGSAPGAGTLTGENRRWPNEPGIPGVVRFFAPFPYRSPFHTRDPRDRDRSRHRTSRRRSSATKARRTSRRC